MDLAVEKGKVSKKLDPNNKAWTKDPDRTFYQLIDD
jgi:hypothetical protein